MDARDRRCNDRRSELATEQTQLHRAGLVQTLVSPGKRRIHQLVLTPAGLALEQQITALVRVHFQAAFGMTPRPPQRQIVVVPTGWQVLPSMLR